MLFFFLRGGADAICSFYQVGLRADWSYSDIKAIDNYRVIEMKYSVGVVRDNMLTRMRLRMSQSVIHQRSLQFCGVRRPYSDMIHQFSCDNTNTYNALRCLLRQLFPRYQALEDSISLRIANPNTDTRGVKIQAK